MMLIDGFAPEGVTQLAVDSIFMMPQLGVLAGIHREAATQVFRRDCLIRLGTCIACTGQPKAGQTALTVTVNGKPTEAPAGEIVCVPLALGESRQVEMKPARGLDVGAGRGKPLTATVHGGEVGLIIDTRGRPIQVPGDETARAAAVNRWLAALKAYPG
jgi:hypothetical protein